MLLKFRLAAHFSTPEAEISPCGSGFNKMTHSGAMPCGHETADTLRFVRPTGCELSRKKNLPEC